MVGFKLISWAYELGVKHERARIAAALSNELAFADRHERNVMARLNARPNPETEIREKIDLEATNKIRAMIHHLFHSEGEWVAGKSIMFPEEDK